MKTWYQVWINFRVFGFCVQKDSHDIIRITSHPIKAWENAKLDFYKTELIKQRAIVSKIADVCQ